MVVNGDVGRDYYFMSSREGESRSFGRWFVVVSYCGNICFGWFDQISCSFRALIDVVFGVGNL